MAQEDWSKFKKLDDEIRANHPDDPEIAERTIKLGRMLVRTIRQSCFVKRGK